MFKPGFALFGLFFYLLAPLHAARGETVSIVDWQTSGNPFARSESLSGLSIASTAELSHPTDARVNMTWSCVKNGTSLSIGISSGNLDYSPVSNKLPLQLKIDRGAVTSFAVVPDSPRRFVIADHLDPRVLFANDAANIYKTNYLYIGFPANGEDMALRINFQDSGARQFMGACLSLLQGHSEKKQVQTEIKHLQAEIDQVAPASAPAPTPVHAPLAQPAAARPLVVQVVAKPMPAPMPASSPPVVTRPPLDLSEQVEAKPLPPVEDPAVEQTDSYPESKNARWKALGKYNLDAGEEVVLRKEYTPGTARIPIGALYKDIPHNDDDKVSLKTGDVSLGGDDTGGRSTALTIVDVHQNRDGLDDWYRVKVTCTGCSSDAAPPEGWVAASDLISWRDDPLCVLGTKDCD